MKKEPVYVTDLMIKEECDELLKECIDWSKNTFGTHPYSFSSEDIRSIGITRFLYLKDKIFEHSPKFYRKKDLKYGGDVIIKKEE